MSDVATTAGVVTSRRLRGEAVACVLERASIRVLRGEAAPEADVVVLVEPGDIEWQQARAWGRPVVALVAEAPEGRELVELVEAGACGVLPRACEPAELVAALDRVAAGDAGLTGQQARRLVEALQVRHRPEQGDPSTITKREREILAAIEAGLSVTETARQLQISPRTVENTQRLLFRKLGVRNRSEAVARALQAGLLDARPNRESS